MRNSFLSFGFIFIFLPLIFIINNNVGWLGISFFVLHALIVPLFIYFMLLKRNFVSLILWAFIEMSFFSYMQLRSGGVYDDHLSSIRSESLIFSFLLGGLVSIVYMFFCIVFSFFIKSKKNIFHDYSFSSNLNLKLVILFIAFVVFTFFISALSFFLGITVMGSETSILPYKFTGILNNYRNIVVPMVFCAFILAFSKYNKSGYVLFFFFAWSLFESYIKLSKGVLILNFMLVLILYLGIGVKFRVRHFFLIFLLMLVVVMSFSVVQNARKNFSESEVIAINNDENYVFLDSFNRLIFRSFLDGFYLAKFHQYKASSDDFLFDEISLYGGVPRFHTQVIDGVPKEIHHSSGSSAFAEAYLLGGEVLAIILAIIYALLISIAEILKRLKGFFIFYVFLSYQIIYTTNIGLINLVFFDSSYFFALCLAGFLSFFIPRIIKN